MNEKPKVASRFSGSCQCVKFRFGRILRDLSDQKNPQQNPQQNRSLQNPRTLREKKGITKSTLGAWNVCKSQDTFREHPSDSNHLFNSQKRCDTKGRRIAIQMGDVLQMGGVLKGLPFPQSSRAPTVLHCELEAHCDTNPEGPARHPNASQPD